MIGAYGYGAKAVELHFIRPPAAGGQLLHGDGLHRLYEAGVHDPIIDSPSGAGFDADPIIDSLPNALRGAQVSFCGLNGNVAEQELDLFQLPAGGLA